MTKIILFGLNDHWGYVQPLSLFNAFLFHLYSLCQSLDMHHFLHDSKIQFVLLFLLHVERSGQTFHIHSQTTTSSFINCYCFFLCFVFVIISNRNALDLDIMSRIVITMHNSID